MTKTVRNSLELLLLLLFLFGLFSGYVLDPFWAVGLFLGLTISPHSHIPVTNIPEYSPWAKGTSYQHATTSLYMVVFINACVEHVNQVALTKRLLLWILCRNNNVIIKCLQAN